MSLFRELIRAKRRIKQLEGENSLLRKAVGDEVAEKYAAYKRIAELTAPKETTPIDRNYRGFSK